MQTANVAYFQQKIQFSGFPAYLDGSLFQLIRISGVKLYYILQVCFCSLRYPPCSTHAPCYFAVCGVPGLEHYFINGRFFRKKLLNTKYVFWFSLQILCETFLILRRTERVVIMTVHTSSCTVVIMTVHTVQLWSWLYTRLHVQLWSQLYTRLHVQLWSWLYTQYSCDHNCTHVQCRYSCQILMKIKSPRQNF